MIDRTRTLPLDRDDGLSTPAVAALLIGALAGLAWSGTAVVLRVLAVALLCIVLAGCDTLGLKGKFENLLVTTVSGDRAFVASMYWSLGITSELRAEDARELQRLRESARMAEEMARYMQRQVAGAKP